MTFIKKVSKHFGIQDSETNFNWYEIDMAKKTQQLDITLEDKDWRMWKTLTNKSVCKYLKDPSAVFLLGLKSACNVHQ